MSFMALMIKKSFPVVDPQPGIFKTSHRFRDLMINHRITRLLWGLIFLILLATPVQPQTVALPPLYWDKIAFPILQIQDSTIVAELARELVIPLDSLNQTLVLVDLNFNGPGIKDLIIVYPAQMIYFIEFLPDRLVQLMRQWPACPSYSWLLSDAEVFDRLDSTKMTYLPFLKNLHSNIRTVFGPQPIKLFYSQTDQGIQFEILDLARQKFWKADSSTTIGKKSP